MIIKNGEVFQEDGSFRLQDLYVENHRIVASEDEVTDKTIVDAAGLRVIPGLVDIHSHGAFGHDFSDADPEGLKIILKYEKSHGITSYCPTSMTLPAEELKEIFATIKTVGEMKAGATVRGINMEGPFLDAKKKGAHVEGYIRKPDAGFFRELNEYSGSHHRITDQYNPLWSKHLKCSADHRWMNMNPITDHLCHALLIITGSSDQSWFSVRQWLHGIIKMCHMVCTSSHGLRCCIIIGRRMSK